MRLHINGELLALPDPLNHVSDLLNHLGLEKKTVIVELNANILSKEQHAVTQLTDEDRIEIVHFVGGG